MSTKKILIKCFGCQMNKLDSGLLSTALQEKGYVLTDHVKEADAVIFTTCSVRQHAEDRVISQLGHLRHLRKTRPELVIAVSGCMAQRRGQELIDEHGADIVVGPARIPELIEALEENLKQRNPAVLVSSSIRQKNTPEVIRALDSFEYHHDSDQNHLTGQAFIRIMRGCNNMCSYCIVPFVRGPEISRRPQDILSQARKLCDQGVRQITLLGQTVNSYSFQQNGSTARLSDLLHQLSEIESLEWIRFITSHPLYLDDSILQAMAALDKVCPYLHMPAQSGSNRVLETMNRRYTREYYLERIAKAREIVPDIAIAGDFIVGFPGETQADFEQTLNLVEQVRYKNCFVFQYSPRPGTQAEQTIHDDVPPEVKKQRNIELLEAVNRISEENNQQFIGQTVQVLVEGESKKSRTNRRSDGIPQLTGRTATDSIVVFHGPIDLAGKMVKVRIQETTALTLIGERIE